MRKQKFIVPLLLSTFAFSGLLASPGEQQGTKSVAPEYQMVKRAVEQNPRGTASDSKIYNEICKEIEGYVQSKKLPDYHLKYYREGAYQQVYLKLGRGPEKIDSWATKTEDQLKNYVLFYKNDIKEFEQLFENIHVPISSLQPNEAIGLHFDGTYLNFYWTSEYNPYEGINLQSITLNGVTYNQKANEGLCSHLNGDGMFEITSSIHYPQLNLSLHSTPIGGFHECMNDKKVYQYGIGLNTKDYKITGFTANIDPIMNGIEPGTEDKVFGTAQKVVSKDQKEFNFSKLPEYKKNAMMQLSSHCYVIVTDVECQSQYVPNFGGYQHAVYFNTSIPLDDVYRADVSYDVSSDEKPWYDFVANYGSMPVAKSLTPEVANGGIFGLSKYQGLTKGEFKSHEKEAKTYQYQLFLNYDSDGWNLFHSKKEDESKYTNVKNFKLLRLNYLYKGQVKDVPIQMDEIDGTSTSIFDKGEISNVNSSYWQHKDNIEEGKDQIGDVVEEVTKPDSKFNKTLKIVLGTVGGILLIYGIYKITKFFINLFKKDEGGK